MIMFEGEGEKKVMKVYGKSFAIVQDLQDQNTCFQAVRDILYEMREVNEHPGLFAKIILLYPGMDPRCWNRTLMDYVEHHLSESLGAHPFLKFFDQQLRIETIAAGMGNFSAKERFYKAFAPHFDFTQNLYGVDFSHSMLASSRTGHILAVDCLFEHIDGYRIEANRSVLQRCSFNEAKLLSSSFRRSMLFACDFRGADLKYADFTGADLRQADFTGAKVEGAIFEDAMSDNDTKFPEGFDPKNHSIRELGVSGIAPDSEAIVGVCA